MTERTPAAQLATARLLIAQFETQLTEHAAMNREQRRTPRGRDLTRRLPDLRQGLATWQARATELETRISEDAG